jgi:hypothetical protein
MDHNRCRYQEQNSSLTLREGLQDYYQANLHLADMTKYPDEAADFFRSHDRIHVIFGCDTSVMHEARTDFWTMMGSDMGFRKYLKYAASPVVRSLYQDLKQNLSDKDKERIRKDFKSNWLRALLTPLTVYRRARRMEKKWPWNENDRFLDRSLMEIRQEFGIQIL